jgi:hypothetical protein
MVLRRHLVRVGHLWAPTSFAGGKGPHIVVDLNVLVGELARRVGRSPDTIKRWVNQGLLPCDRDDRNRRIFGDEHVARCLELIRLSVSAQIRNRKLVELADELPEQLNLV